MIYAMNDPNLPARGRLQIDAVASDMAHPAPNARVRVMPHDESNITVEEMVTDSSGQTPIAILPAPPEEHSLQPSDHMPYSEYDVTVDLEGYEPVTVKGVQILPDTGSFLQVELHSVTGGVGAETVKISDHTLWGNFPPKIPEDEVKPLPETTGLVVLPKPVVPEIVVVHDGMPQNTGARRFYVPFADYIKNVIYTKYQIRRGQAFADF
ncbi:MAG: carboxypeptidase-like regulatory domain-containing protein [Oscillospiraceae bacterium]|nr:carboxypeptidase-like regulatory domain-containing protein [Oscillospiraceae bacterium]